MLTTGSATVAVTTEVFALAGAHTLRSLIDWRAQQTPQAVFFIGTEDGQTVSYGRLAAVLQGLGGVLAGVPPGAAVGMMGGNGWAATQILLGAAYHGRMALLLNLAAGDGQLAYMINHSDCRLIFADPDNLSRLQNIVKQCKNAVAVVAIGAAADIASAAAPLPPLTAASPALLIYTSGTTGRPKGVVHSHRSLLSGGANTAAAHRLSAADRALCVLPLYHINGQCVTVMAPLLSGGSVVMPRRFSTRLFWRWLQVHQCTWFSVVPTIVSHLLHGEEKPPPLPHLRFGRSASAALSPSTHQEFENRFSVILVETMGLTETAAQILSNPPPPARGKYGSPGVAVGNQVRIIDRQGQPLPPGREGEIAVRGDNLMLGYLHEESVFVDGWMLSGDLGRMDQDGYVFVTGRLKELIIKGGENIAPREIDDALYAAAGVVEAAAFGVPCEIYGQQVEAAVVLSSPTANNEAELLAVCRRAVGEFKAPRRIHLRESLPKGPSGKIQRLKLAELPDKN